MMAQDCKNMKATEIVCRLLGMGLAVERNKLSLMSHTEPQGQTFAKSNRQQKEFEM